MTVSHRKNRTEAEKHVDVRNLLLLAQRSTGRAWLTTNEIAKGIGMARNGRLKSMLDWMVTCGSLERRECERPGRWPGYEYMLSENIRRFYNRPARSIPVKTKGKSIASLEMVL